jgi:hypothetical protein
LNHPHSAGLGVTETTIMCPNGVAQPPPTFFFWPFLLLLFFNFLV